MSNLAVRSKSHDHIIDLTYKHLNTSLLIFPRAYGVLKIHKTGNPLKIIISSVNSSLHNLANFIHKIIFNNLYRVLSITVSKLIYEVTYGESFELISLDVISLFTNIPLDLAINSLERRWHLIKNNTLLSKEEFFVALRFVFNSTYFQFNNKFYKQTYGAPMGSPLSPIS